MARVYSIFILFLTFHTCYGSQRFLLYDVNRGEGFNLQRDVYIRMANTIRILNKDTEQWTLVLPPWNSLYHWHNTQLVKLPWSTFFHTLSLNLLLPVMELEEFLKVHPSGVIDMVYHMGHFDFDRTTNMDFILKRKEHCSPEELGFRQSASSGMFHSWFHGYGDKLKAKSVACMMALAGPDTLSSFLKKENYSVVYISHAETILNGHLSEWSPEYWSVRRSMLFAAHLRQSADNYRAEQLNSSDLTDRTVIPPIRADDTGDFDWTVESWPSAPAVGGPYLAVHWRRGDFVRNDLQTTGSETWQVPSIESAAFQIAQLAKQLHLTSIFVATDATNQEKARLRDLLQGGERLSTHYYSPPSSLTPGEAAIIEQWICAHGRAFIGTHISTFSFRIHEERQIMGFPANMTYIAFCHDSQIGNVSGSPCQQPTHWPVQIERPLRIRRFARDNNLPREDL